ncbi:MAG: RHS repeat-associated core domain-containing protein, partial [Planctomycetia bacterium]
MTRKSRRHDTAGNGPLAGPAAEPKARLLSSAAWADGVGRTRATADFGANGGAAFTRPATIPARSDDVLVTTTAYDDRGEAFQSIDPAGTEYRAGFDDAGRLVHTIDNFKASGSAADENYTIEVDYDADGNVVSRTVLNAATGDQTTVYVYGTTLADGPIASSLLLRAKILPDSTGGADRFEYRYDRQRRLTEQKDQRGVVHAYDYDKLGRLVHDRVPTLPAGVDGAVRRISTTYDVRGLPTAVAGWSDAAVGSGS